MSLRQRDVAEVAYQLLIAEDESAVLEDAEKKFGEKAREIIEEARKLVQEVLEEAGGDAGEAAQRIVAKYGLEVRASSPEELALIRYMARRSYQPVPEDAIRDLSSLLETELRIDDLLRRGILMHVKPGHVTVPQYVNAEPREITLDVELLLDEAEHNIVGLAVLESWLESNQPNVEMFEKMYGVPYESALKSLHLRKLVKYSEALNDLIFNPLIDVEEFRSLYHSFKQSRAKRILRTLDIGIGHVKYSKRIGALVACIAFGPGEHGLIIMSPWIVPGRRLERYCANVARLIVLNIPFRKEFAEYYHTMLEGTKSFRNTAFVFIQEGVAYLVAPEKRSKTLDSLIDFVYRAGLEVFEF